MPKFVLFFCILSLSVSASTAVRVATPQSKLEASTSYYLDLLRLVLDKTATEYGPAHLEFEPAPGTGSLWKLLLNKKRLDVH